MSNFYVLVERLTTDRHEKIERGAVDKGHHRRQAYAMSLLHMVAIHVFRRTAGLTFTIALSLVTLTSYSIRAQTSAAPGPPSAAQHPAGPPPGSPAPGSRCLGCGTAPEPIDYNDRAGWTQIFDGKSLTNWDGNPEVWRVDDGAISAANSPERRVGTTYIIWRGGEPGDFELKLEVKADYDVHGGIFYRGSIGPEPPRAGGPGSAARGSAPVGSPRPQPAPPAVPSDPRWNVRGYAMDWDYDPGNNGNVQDPGAGRTDTQIVWRGHIVHNREREAAPLDRHPWRSRRLDEVHQPRRVEPDPYHRPRPTAHPHRQRSRHGDPDR